MSELLLLAQAEDGRDWILRLFNMTSYANLPWFLLGVAGQIAFFLRMFIQWIATEKSRQSVIPPLFWWLSLGGAVLLFTYAIWRKDIVFTLGQSFGLIVYSRNLWFIHTHKAAAAARADASSAADAAGSPPSGRSEKPGASDD
ncbi:MAG: lipid-A-disaccharide synthase N-terminal domain-containing protein [Planctomycetota bacterium]|nr:lipid-A-disaccharide synthase N-terminal domain-containing protein [Planctomycetota bacterium]